MTKIFPIQSDPACLLKWGWSSIYFQSGSSSSCHRTQKYPIDPDSFSNFHNLPAKVQAREKMLKGEWPGAGCEYCKQAEDQNLLSDRQFQLEQLHDKNLVPPELFTNPDSLEVTPTMIEVYFSNTCNMSCVYCGPQHSSKWVEENKKYGNYFSKVNTDKFSVLETQQNPHYDKMVKSFWAYLAQDNRAKKIQRYHILGGEPFLLKEFNDSINFWARHGHPDLQISIISNFNIPHDRFKTYIDRFRILVKHTKMWRLQLTASLDGWSQDQEYLRYGLNLDLWEKNFEHILKTDWILPSINSVISALSIKSMPALLEKINHWNKEQPSGGDDFRTYPLQIIHSFNTSTGLDNPYIFGSGVFDEDFEKILSIMPEETPNQQGQKSMMQSIAEQQRKSTRNHHAIAELKKYLDELDRRRNTNWRDHYSWLDSLS